MKNIKDLWDMVEGENNFINNYDAIKAELLAGISYGNEEDYDPIEFFLDLVGYHSETNQIDRLKELSGIIENQYSDLFDKLFFYIHDGLITYACFMNDEKMLRESLAFFEKKPDADLDILFYALEKIFQYGFDDIMEDFIPKIYPKLVTDSEIFPSSLEELTDFDLFIKINKCQNSTKKNEAENIEILEKTLEKYDRTLDEEKLKKQILHYRNSDLLTSELIANTQKGNDFELLYYHFTRYAAEKRLSLPLVMSLMNVVYSIFKNKEKSRNNFFDVSAQTYFEVVDSQIGFMDKDQSRAVVLVAVLSYFNDFLLKNEVIDTSIHHKNQMINANIKDRYLKHETFNLWIYKSIYNWIAPDSKTPEAWKEEAELFESTFSKSIEKTDEDRKEITEKLAATFPPKSERGLEIYQIPQRRNFLNNLNFGSDKKPKNLKPERGRVIDISEKTPKIGRNEKITVQYLDGKVVKDVKYKKVLKDIESGKCKII